MSNPSDTPNPDKEAKASSQALFWRPLGACVVLFLLCIALGMPTDSSSRLKRFLDKNSWLLPPHTQSALSSSELSHIAKDATLLTLNFDETSRVETYPVALSHTDKKLIIEQFDISTQRNLSLAVKKFKRLVNLDPKVTSKAHVIPESGEQGLVLALNRKTSRTLIMTPSGEVYSAIINQAGEVTRYSYYTSLTVKQTTGLVAGKSLRKIDKSLSGITLPFRVSIIKNGDEQRKGSDTASLLRIERTHIGLPQRATAIVVRKQGKRLKKQRNGKISAYKKSDTARERGVIELVVLITSEKYTVKNAAAQASPEPSDGSPTPTGSETPNVQQTVTPTDTPESTPTVATTATVPATATPEACQAADGCATKNGGGVCDRCVDLYNAEYAICNADDEPELVPTPCSSDQCCVGNDCTNKTGQVAITLSGCMSPPDPKDFRRCTPLDQDIWYSNEKVISGTATVSGLNVDSPECTLDVVSGVGRVDKVPGGCEPGTGTCTFTITRELVPAALMCGVVTATASGACCSHKSEKIAGLSNYGFTFSPKEELVREGPIEPKRRPRIQLVPFPDNLKVLDHSQTLKANPDYRNLKGPTVGTEKVESVAPEAQNVGVFRVTNSWWVGVSKSPPKENLCYGDVNDYLLSAEATMQAGSCSLSYDSLPDNIFFKLQPKMGVSDGPITSGTSLENMGQNVFSLVAHKMEWRPGPRGERYCVVKISVPRSGSLTSILQPVEIENPWSPVRDQYYGKAQAEEEKHREQYLSLPWAKGGLSDVFNWKNVYLCRTTFTAPTCVAAAAQAGTELGNAIKPLIEFMMSSHDTASDVRCWMEQAAKQMVTLTTEIAAFHLECAYPDCSQQLKPPALPNFNYRNCS